MTAAIGYLRHALRSWESERQRKNEHPAPPPRALAYIGVRRSTKMANTCSPLLYDIGACVTPRSPKLRRRATLRYVLWGASLPMSLSRPVIPSMVAVPIDLGIGVASPLRRVCQAA
jgi:hypothetical protein